MNNTRARHIGNRRIVVQQRIQHSTVRVARARMYNQIARFIDHDDVIIFVNDIERNILRLEARLFFDFDIDSDAFSPSTFSFGLSPMVPLTNTRWSRIHSFIRDRE